MAGFYLEVLNFIAFASIWILKHTAMAILNYNSIAKPTQTFASSSPLPNNMSPSHIKPKPSKHLSSKLQQENLKQQKRTEKPSVLEIERAIGAGIFRDRDPDSEPGEEKEGLADNVFKNSIMSEGSLEKQLRETGEWLIERTEMNSSSYGKNILKAMYVWVLPMWIVAFMLVSGAVKLPYISPLLQDLFS